MKEFPAKPAILITGLNNERLRISLRIFEISWGLVLTKRRMGFDMRHFVWLIFFV